MCPDITLRSTFIVGFPGETEADFQLLLDFLAEAQLDRVGCFQYSPVAGAAANELPGGVPDAVKQERWDRFMQAQMAISAGKLKARIGRTLKVIVDDIDGEDAVCRGEGDAPEIDGQVFVRHDADLKPGDIIEAHIDEAGDYDLWGSYVHG